MIKTLQLNTSWLPGSLYNCSKQMAVNMIEVPPHYRTLKIRYGDSFLYEYHELPCYTQFYFTNIKIDMQDGKICMPTTFISSYHKSFSEGTPLYPIFSNCSFGVYGRICWGDGWKINEVPNNKDLISYFWNSTFDLRPFPLSIHLAEFSIL